MVKKRGTTKKSGKARTAPKAKKGSKAQAIATTSDTVSGTQRAARIDTQPTRAISAPKPSSRGLDSQNETPAPYPDALSELAEKVAKLQEEVQHVDDKIEQSQKEAQESFMQIVESKVEKLDQKISDSSVKAIELIGVISSVIALVLVFVQAASLLESLESAFLVLTLGTFSLVLFVALIHCIIWKRASWIAVLLIIVPLFVYWHIGNEYVFDHSKSSTEEQASATGSALEGAGTGVITPPSSVQEDGSSI